MAGRSNWAFEIISRGCFFEAYERSEIRFCNPSNRSLETVVAFSDSAYPSLGVIALLGIVPGTTSLGGATCGFSLHMHAYTYMANILYCTSSYECMKPCICSGSAICSYFLLLVRWPFAPWHILYLKANGQRFTCHWPTRINNFLHEIAVKRHPGLEAEIARASISRGAKASWRSHDVSVLRRVRKTKKDRLNLESEGSWSQPVILQPPQHSPHPRTTRTSLRPTRHCAVRLSPYGS